MGKKKPIKLKDTVYIDIDMQTVGILCQVIPLTVKQRVNPGQAVEISQHPR